MSSPTGSDCGRLSEKAQDQMDMNRRSVLAGGLAYGGMAGLPGLNHLTDTLAAIRRLRSIGIRDRPTSPRSPWQNGYAERLIGSVRRECLDHVVVFSERHLRHLLLCYMKYCNGARTHLSLEKDAPVSRAVDRAGHILCRPTLGGLHHQYARI
jgi:transposase InsO family protein